MLWLLQALTLYSQDTEEISSAERMRRRDSAIEYYQRKRDSLQQQLYLSDTAQIRRNIQSSADYFVNLQKENRRRQKKAAFIRIGIGMGMLVFLVAVLMRRKKKQGR